ncbi:MAG: DUF2795 domain-containing protein [Acidimicrobiia bacterium]|nr:DUF2795 domain-containing protein [Acidimicrobiia bacterium]
MYQADNTTVRQDQHGNAARSGAPVTRTEVIDTIAHAFDAPSATPDDLVAAARGSHARAEVVDLLSRLPGRRYVRPQDMWNDLPDVPIGD